MAHRLELERGLRLGASAGSLLELPLRPGGQGIPQPQIQPEAQVQAQIQAQAHIEPQESASPAPSPASADLAVPLVTGGPSFSLALRQKEEKKEYGEEDDEEEDRAKEGEWQRRGWRHQESFAFS